MVRDYLAAFRRLGYQSGPELRAASDRLIGLGRKINRLAPGIDWPAIWRQEGAIPTGDPAATWDAETAERITWLESIDAEAVRPFRLPSGRWVANPLAYLGALRRDVAKGPGNPHAGQVAADLRDLVLGMEGVATYQNGTPPAIEPLPAREWDEETAQLIAWLAIAPVPAERFQLDSWRVVSDPVAFLAGLEAAIAQGPDGPRARAGVLRGDLRSYRETVERGGRCQG